MPNKHNAKCRHHLAKMKFSVLNWAEYDAALRARGSLTLWVTAQAMDHWAAQPGSAPGGQCFYSDLAIETSLKLRLAFRQLLRQTEGLMTSIFDLLEATKPIHTRFCQISVRFMHQKEIDHYENQV